jgi:hypothetical protein
MVHTRITSSPPQFPGPAPRQHTLIRSRKRPFSRGSVFCGSTVMFPVHFELLHHLPKDLFWTVGLRILLEP